MKAAQYTFFYLMKPFIALYLRVVFNLRFVNNPLKGVKGPYLVIGHHVKTEDPLFILTASRQFVRFLAGDANMTSPWKKMLFKATGMVPFKKKKSDLKSIRRLMAIVQEKEAIGLYPEGGRNWDGVTDAIIPATAKLIKLLGIDVYVTFYQGGYLTRPRWADYSRRGKMFFTGYRLFEGDALASMTVEEIHEKTEAALAYNEFDWQKDHMIPFRGKNRAVGITRLLWKCPVCEAEHRLRARGNDLVCEACGHRYHYNVYGFLEGHPTLNDAHKWQQWQRGFIPKIAAGDVRYTLPDITYETIGPDNIKEGVWPHSKVTLTKDSLTIDTGSHQVVLAIAHTFGFSFTLQDLLEFYSNEGKHRLVFDPEKHLANLFIYDLMTQLKENLKNDQ